MKTPTSKEAYDWYSQKRSTYEGLCKTVGAIIESLLRSNKIDFLSVTTRAKTIDSFSEKCDRKGYAKPIEEITDLAGIRIITFIEEDAVRAGNLITETFNIHKEKCLDKSTELKVDQFGYRSFHYICDLGENRVKLPEFKGYADLFFEVQVRTVLQHAWAEIEHDRNYKLAGVLPAALQRRLYLIAGMLEIADREFNSVAAELDDYAKEIALKADKGELDAEINSTSILEYLKNKLKDFPVEITDSPNLPILIDELKDCGILTLKELDALLSQEFLSEYANNKPDIPSNVALIRTALMIYDLKGYFAKAWKHRIVAIPPFIYRMLRVKYADKELVKILPDIIKQAGGMK